MSINDATRFDWDRVRDRKTGLEAWMQAAHDEDSELWEEDAGQVDWDRLNYRLPSSPYGSIQPNPPVADPVNAPPHYNTGNIEALEADVAELLSEVEAVRVAEENRKAAHDDDKDSELWEDESLEDIIARQDEEDMVGAPKHYNTGNIECIDAIEESMSSVAFKGYLKGNCMKYLWRYDYKGKQVEDLQKAGWYLNKLTETVTEENT
jgi:hypothetical protein